MKKILFPAVLLSSILASTTAFADTPKGAGPEVINLKMGLMQLPFQHWKHQAFNNSECFHCHKAEGGKIEGWGKETAHNLCIPCHDLNDKGPVECKQCHKK
jgi:predicted CXXCH cytochrome family protein